MVSPLLIGGVALGTMLLARRVRRVGLLEEIPPGTPFKFKAKVRNNSAIDWTYWFTWMVREGGIDRVAVDSVPPSALITKNGGETTIETLALTYVIPCQTYGVRLEVYQDELKNIKVTEKTEDSLAHIASPTAEIVSIWVEKV